LPLIHHIKGKKNKLADNLSLLLWLPTPSQIAEGKKLVELAIVSDDEDDDEGFLASCEDSGCLDEDIYNIFECYLNLPKIPNPAQNPLSLACIREQQQQDKQLLALQVKYPQQYVYKSLDEDVEDILCYVHPGDNPDAMTNCLAPTNVGWNRSMVPSSDGSSGWETLMQNTATTLLSL
jgi:hypothetical protein